MQYFYYDFVLSVPVLTVLLLTCGHACCSKVEQWRKTRSDGQVERRDFIKENRAKANAASAASIIMRRSELFSLERQKTAEAALRKGAHEDERQRVAEARFAHYVERDAGA